MMHLLILAVHLLATIAKLVRPGGVRAVMAESLLLKQQLLISSRCPCSKLTWRQLDGVQAGHAA